MNKQEQIIEKQIKQWTPILEIVIQHFQNIKWSTEDVKHWIKTNNQLFPLELQSSQTGEECPDSCCGIYSQSPSEDKIMSAEEIFKKHHPLIYGMGTGEFKNNFISAMEEYASQFSQSQRKVVTNEMIIDAGAEYFNNEKTDGNKYVAFREGAKWMRDLLSDNGK